MAPARRSTWRTWRPDPRTLRGLTAEQVNQAGEIRSARVESLRALAALGVLVAGAMTTAYQAQIPHDYPHRLLFSGTYAVYLFFVLSGYLLFWPFARRTFGDGQPIDLRRYALNRALRILPLYYVVLVAYLLIREGGGSLDQWLLFGSFSENLSTSTILRVNGAMWSLVVELHFYALLPLLALLLASVSRSSLRVAAAVVVGVGLASFVLRWVTLYGDRTPNPYLRYSLPSCFMFFAPGMALALLRLAWERRRPPILDGLLGARATWMAGAAGVWLAVAQGTGHGYLAAPASFLLVGACVLPLRESRAARVLDWRPLALLGVASYSLYLWHSLVIDELADHVASRLLPLLALATPLCLGVAFLSYAAIERPFLRLRRRWGSTAAGRGPRTRSRYRPSGVAPPGPPGQPSPAPRRALR
jgi:acetyltransferase